MILTFARIGGDFQTEGAVERGEVGQAMRLEQRVGLDVAVFDFVQRTGAARRVAEGGEIGVEEGVEGVGSQGGDQRLGGWRAGLADDVLGMRAAHRLVLRAQACRATASFPASGLRKPSRESDG